VAELRVPELVEDPFREHYRALILGSLLRAAEEQSERRRGRSHRLRARKVERVVDLLRPPREAPPAPVTEPSPVREPVSVPASVEAPVAVRRIPMVGCEPWLGTTIRRTAAAVWFATLAALVANVVVLGLDSYATAAADLTLVAMSFVWFFACIDDLIAPSA
jgi:hypothetical protein